MRIPSGVTDQGFYFVAVDATDYVTRETGLSSFTVVRSRNGAADATMTTPTITEIDNSTMPGVYFLLCDEDMTLAAGDQSQAMAFHITHAGMAPVTREIEIYRPSVTAGETLTVSSGLGSANATQISGSSTAADNVEVVFATDFATNYDTTLDRWQVDVDTWLGTAAQGASGRPQVDVELWLGSAPNALVSGRVDSSTGAMATGVVTATAVATGAIDADALAADAGTEIGTAVWATAARTLTALDEDSTTIDLDAAIRAAVGLASADLDTQLAALPTAAEVTDAVWDEAISGHLSAGTTGDALFVAATNPAPSAADVADAVWDEATTSHTTSGTFGEQLKTDVDAILADTNELQGDWVNGGRLDLILDARASQTSVDTIDGIVDDILLDTAEIGTAGAGLTNINLPDQTMNITGNVTGNLSGSVGSVTAGVTLANDAVSAAALAADAIAEINATVDTAISDAALATAANLATVDTVVDDIKAKTDSLTFTVTGQVDANIESVNATTVTGSGTEANPWGP